MDILKHFKKNNIWWYKVLFTSFFISIIFPYMMYEDKSQTYNVITNSIGSIIGGLVLFTIVYLIFKVLRKKLNENQEKITLLICFSFWWILQILNHFNIKHS